MVAQVAAQHEVPMIDIRLSQMEPTDLRGIPFRNGAAVEWAIPAMLPDPERHGLEGILFLDEITSAAPTVSAAAYQLILDRRLGEYCGAARLGDLRRRQPPGRPRRDLFHAGAAR